MDHIQTYNSWWYYQKHRCYVKSWLNWWGDLNCDQISKQMVREYLRGRKETASANAANKDLRHLRACLNRAKTDLDLTVNPTDGIGYFPERTRLPYIPPEEDLQKVFAVARSHERDYLWVIRDTLARVGDREKVLTLVG